MSRTLVLWCPDWPVTAARQAAGSPPDRPAAVLEAGRLLAVSAAARSVGLRRGLRIREAQSRCPELVVFPHDPRLEARAFEPVLEAVESVAPGVQVVRPGTCAVRAGGLSRYLGGESDAAAAVLVSVADAGVPGARAGVADGPFVAEQAARTTNGTAPRTRVVDPGAAASFLAGLSVEVLGPLLGDPAAVDLLRRLGLRTVGAFAELDGSVVAARFGADGVRAHRLARGVDEQRLQRREAPPELTRVVEFDPPLDRVDQVAFTLRSTADAFVAALAAQVLVCTGLRVETRDDRGGLITRTWLHPRFFTAADVVDRVRWQIGGGGLAGPVARVDLVPEDVVPHGEQADGLWGGAPDEQLHRALTRMQGRLGHAAVGTAVVGGGRGPVDRLTFVPWGDRPLPRRAGDRPWPGQLPPPLPTTVLPRPVGALVVGPDGAPVAVDERGVLSAAPTRLRISGDRPREGWPADWQPIQAWAGPWAVDERWWEDDAAGRMARFQVVGVDGSAWLLLVDDDARWWVEARYD
ncbi:DNA polymerase Y family protein [Klenkia terrae]|uniref:DNA polymerase Y family protein n=1 Tax=Klenkia terrae TaxID=1052259 RepID=A0ABU8E5H2_9ACTN